jgi:hypothetical protein
MLACKQYSVSGPCYRHAAADNVLLVLHLQSDANEKLNELEEQLQQIKDQIKVSVVALLS